MDFAYLALCIRNGGNAASLERGKAYRVLKPHADDPRGHLRVVDEDGEDYLFPSDWFVPLSMSSMRRRQTFQALYGGK